MPRHQATPIRRGRVRVGEGRVSFRRQGAKRVVRVLFRRSQALTKGCRPLDNSGPCRVITVGYRCFPLNHSMTASRRCRVILTQARRFRYCRVTVFISIVTV